jgi:hypothetical protein
MHNYALSLDYLRASQTPAMPSINHEYSATWLKTLIGQANVQYSYERSRHSTKIQPNMTACQCLHQAHGRLLGQLWVIPKGRKEHWPQSHSLFYEARSLLSPDERRWNTLNSVMTATLTRPTPLNITLTRSPRIYIDLRNDQKLCLKNGIPF